MIWIHWEPHKILCAVICYVVNIYIDNVIFIYYTYIKSYYTDNPLLYIYYNLKTTRQNHIFFLHYVPKLPIKILFLSTLRNMKADFCNGGLVIF